MMKIGTICFSIVDTHPRFGVSFCAVLVPLFPDSFLGTMSWNGSSMERAAMKQNFLKDWLPRQRSITSGRKEIAGCIVALRSRQLSYSNRLIEAFETPSWQEDSGKDALFSYSHGLPITNSY
ncbi:unnamed protein product [Microthlaspi erraticum]|uniref:Uncharacterized protein n=1 Tax=Microthlaspi erraticum TaxID=1685480 RepID=A0A6D2HHE6_9BRAS|nr:unnamed protein product [Microthlaspi erraticum]